MKMVEKNKIYNSTEDFLEWMVSFQVKRGGRNVKNHFIERSEHRKSHKFDQNVESQKEQNV